MRIIAFVVGIGLMLAILVDAFEAVLMPRRVTHGYRLIRLFYQVSWRAWRQVAGWIRARRFRESFLSLFGPLSFLVMFGMWAVGLIMSFGLLHWALQTRMTAPGSSSTLGSYLYFSGVTFFTLGYGDLAPAGISGRLLSVMEAGLGFGFLAVVISYHPVFSQAFSDRETTISLLDARGGSPPTAEQILIRARQSTGPSVLNSFLTEWEEWSAALLESCLSYPILAFYRSQHDNQSWLATLTAILDTTALCVCGWGDADPYRVRLTFAIARHAAVDLCLVFKIAPRPPETSRASSDVFEQLAARLEQGGVPAGDGPSPEVRLEELRAMYEPFVNGLSEYFLFKLPGFFPDKPVVDNWRTSAWMPRTPSIQDLPAIAPDEHFV